MFTPTKVAAWWVLFCICLPLSAQKVALAKYPKKFSPLSKVNGPRPGSPASSGDTSASYSRTLIYPAALRALIRVECQESIKEQKLIDRAKKLPKNSAPQQLDWGNPGKGKVGFYAVVEILVYEMELPMVVKEGKFVASGKARENYTSQWYVQRVDLGQNRTCVAVKEVNQKEMRTAIENVLVAQTLIGFRSH